MTEERRGLDLPENVRKSLASAVLERGAQARMVSTRGRESMRPPKGHVVTAASWREIEGIRGPARIVRQLEFYKTFYGPVVRLAFTVYPMDGEPFSAATLLNVSQVSGDAALSGLGRQREVFFHFYYEEEGDLAYAFSKEIPNGERQRDEAKKILKMARDAYAETPEQRRSFRSAVGLAERQFESVVSEPEDREDL
ncbi:hypothetical protein GBA63_03005 [Rubrobacter tropicus]|uniref:Uncharacterized protein n=1 Tax=Rubrobacter tropicus TaxID=2653851 RepID=A0A6G8Q5K0_9ACTN|nr:hypothetical protein [Rubrobacter tropicus]QIN81718.1 hypothetical protein GBA63_03005 [Rubrobacter tropicus]